jgi:hypothetical protein
LDLAATTARLVLGRVGGFCFVLFLRHCHLIILAVFAVFAVFATLSFFFFVVVYVLAILVLVDLGCRLVLCRLCCQQLFLRRCLAKTE